MQPTPQNAVYDLDCCLSPDGKIYFIEIAARSPGGTNPQMYAEAYQGLNIEQTHVNLQLGLPIEELRPTGKFCASFGIPRLEGWVTGLSMPDLAGDIRRLEWQVKMGSTYPFAKGMSETTCTYVITTDNFATLRRDFDLASQYRGYARVEAKKANPSFILIKFMQAKRAALGIGFTVFAAGAALYFREKPKI